MIKKLAKVLTNILSLGGYNALEAAISKYEAVYLEHEGLRKSSIEMISGIEFIRKNIQREVDMAVKTANRANSLLSKVAGEIKLKSLSMNSNASHAIVNSEDQKYISPGVSGVKSLGTAGVIGTTVVAGSWTVVSFIGTASTGTAIGSLSGAAMSNAVLAWFGGGSIAAGGGGMAVGTTVLGGLLVVPVVVWSTWSMYSKKDKILAEVRAIEKQLLKVKSQIEDIQSFSSFLRDRQAELGHHRTLLQNSIDQAKRALFPWGIFTRLWRWVRSKFGYPYFYEYECGCLFAVSDRLRTLNALFVGQHARPNP